LPARAGQRAAGSAAAGSVCRRRAAGRRGGEARCIMRWCWRSRWTWSRATSGRACGSGSWTRRGRRPGGV